MTLVIGLVGEKFSGKGTFVALLKKIAPEADIHHERFSDILRETLKKWNLPITRENLQKLVLIMNRSFDRNTFTTAVCERIKRLPADIVILDGVRWKTDAQMIRSFTPSCLVYITASLETRYARTSFRQENVGECGITLERFIKEDKAPNEVYIPQIGASADLQIDNNGTLEEFEAQVRTFCHRFIWQDA